LKTKADVRAGRRFCPILKTVNWRWCNAVNRSPRCCFDFDSQPVVPRNRDCTIRCLTPSDGVSESRKYGFCNNVESAKRVEARHRRSNGKQNSCRRSSGCSDRSGYRANGCWGRSAASTPRHSWGAGQSNGTSSRHSNLCCSGRSEKHGGTQGDGQDEGDNGLKQ
jgi:hypothetical protein